MRSLTTTPDLVSRWLIQNKQRVTLFNDSTASPRAGFLVVEPNARRRPSVQALERWLLDGGGGAATLDR